MTGLPDTLQLPFFTSLAVTAIGVVLLQLVLCVRQPADYLGLAVYPLAAVALLAGQASGEGGTVQGHAVQIHVLLSVLAYAVLSLTAAQAGLVAIQRHFLSRHRPGGFMRALPPLDTTERLLFALLTAGFALLTLSLASGFLYLEDMFAQHLVHKSVLACIAWAIFGVLLFGRWRFGWRGRARGPLDAGRLRGADPRLFRQQVRAGARARARLISTISRGRPVKFSGTRPAPSRSL